MLNNVSVCGRLVKDCTLEQVGRQTVKTRFTVAVNRNYKDGSGGNKEQVSFIDCSAWGRSGEIIAQYAKKGSGILVSGRIEQRSWEDKEGQKRSRVEIVVEDFNFIGGGNSDGGNYSGSSKSSTGSNEAQDVAPDDISDEPIDLSEIPF